MADPPWDIHMELPYGTLSDDEMRQLGVPNLQDDGLLFLWVTGRYKSDISYIIYAYCYVIDECDEFVVTLLLMITRFHSYETGG